jgi:hypothetical protein
MEVTLIGGEKLKSTLSQMAEKVGVSTVVRVGFLEGATYPDGTSVAEVAMINEFGAPAAHIPPRPFFRNAISQNSPTWGKRIAAAMKQCKLDSKKALALVGMKVGEQIVRSIESNTPPENAPSTAKRKGFKGGAAVTLQDTKHMKRSVEYEVSNGGERKKVEAK